MKKFLSIIIIYSFFFSCKHDLENPTWDVDMIVPIANAEININDIYVGNISLSMAQQNHDDLYTKLFRN